MADTGARKHQPEPRRAAAVVLVVVLVGLLLLLVSYLLPTEKPLAGTPSPRALFKATLFTIPPHGRACMSSTTLPPNGRILQLELGEANGSAHGSPPMDVLLSAPGYLERAQLPSEQSEGSVQVPVRPPRHYVIGSICLVNRGATPAVLAGSTEPRAISRSKLTINGKATEGDIALTFLGRRAESRLSRVGEVFSHASTLTDHLIPVWLVWILAVTALLTAPVAVAAMFWRALREDEVA
jgi:hypothetical protein